MSSNGGPYQSPIVTLGCPDTSTPGAVVAPTGTTSATSSSQQKRFRENEQASASPAEVVQLSDDGGREEDGDDVVLLDSDEEAGADRSEVMEPPVKVIHRNEFLEF